MSTLDQQIGVKDEVTYGTGVTVDRFFEFNSETITDAYGRTEGNPLRPGHWVMRNDRYTPYMAGAAGGVQIDVLSKGFGWWLKHMLGTSGTTGPTETVVYTHTGTVGDLLGDFFTLQVSRPLNPAGTAQPFTYTGGKVTDWTLSNTVDGNLVADLNLDFQSVTDATGLATASYPTDCVPLSWVGGSVTVGGSAFDLSTISVACNNGLNVERRRIRNNPLKKEPTGGRREVTWSLEGDFDATTLRTKAASSTVANNLASIVAVWEGPTIITGATTLKPKLTLTIDEARFDTWAANNSGPEALPQTLTGVGRYDGTTSPVTIAYQSADATA